MLTYVVNISMVSDNKASIVSYHVEANTEEEAKEKAQTLFTDDYPGVEGEVLEYVDVI